MNGQNGRNFSTKLDDSEFAALAKKMKEGKGQMADRGMSTGTASAPETPESGADFQTGAQPANGNQFQEGQGANDGGAEMDAYLKAAIDSAMSAPDVLMKPPSVVSLPKGKPVPPRLEQGLPELWEGEKPSDRTRFDEAVRDLEKSFFDGTPQDVFEQAAVITPDGKVVLQGVSDGQKAFVALPPEMLPGNIITHSHLMEYPLTADDIFALLMSGARAIRAVTPTTVFEATYTGSNPEEDLNKLRDFFRNNLKEILQRVVGGKMGDPAQALDDQMLMRMTPQIEMELYQKLKREMSGAIRFREYPL